VTDAYFSMARAARLVSHRTGNALVHSSHTDTPGYTRIYADQVIRRVCGEAALGRILRERWRVPERLKERMQRRLESYLRACDWAMTADELPRADRPQGVSILRRGVDREKFHPAHRDRERLQREYAIGPERLVLLFVGRVDAGKDVMTVAHATRTLL